MSEENELRVKFVIDDTDFRNQLDQLRGDLERERRLEPGDVERPSQDPRINVTIGGDGGRTDPEDIRQINLRIDDIERRSGTPRVFEESTPAQLRDLLGEAMKMPGWEGILLDNPSIADRFAFIANEAVRRYPDSRVTDIRREGDPQTAGALRKLYDTIYHISGIIETNRATGAGTVSEEALRQMVLGLVSTQGDVGEDKARMSAFHRAEQIVIRDLLTGELGKTAGLEMVSGRSKFDIYAPYMAPLGSRGDADLSREDEVGTGWGLLIAEVKGTRATGVTATQMGKYARQGIDILRDFYKDKYNMKEFKEYLLRNPKISGPRGEAGRIKLYLDFITMMKGGDITADIKQELMTGTMEDREFWEEFFQMGGIEIVQSRMPEELQRRLAVTWKDGMKGEDLVPVIYNYLDEFPEHLEQVLTDLNPSFRRGTLEDTRKRLRDIIGLEGPREDKVERGTQALRDLLDRQGPQYVMRAAQDVTDTTRAELFPGISRRAGRRRGSVRNRELATRLVEFLPGLAETLVDMGEISDEEMMETVVAGIMDGAAPDVDPAIIRRRQAREGLSNFLSDMASDSETAEAMRMPFGRDDDPEDGTTGEDQVMDLIATMMPEVGAIPIEMDWKRYMAGLEMYAKEVRKEYGISMTGERYFRWMGAKGKGELPEDILEGTGLGGLSAAFAKLREEGRAGSPVAEELMEFMGDRRDPRLPVTQQEINFIREQMSDIENIIDIMGRDGTFSGDDAALMVRVSRELEAFEKMYTRMEPATSIMTMRWS